MEQSSKKSETKMKIDESPLESELSSEDNNTESEPPMHHREQGQ